MNHSNTPKPTHKAKVTAIPLDEVQESLYAKREKIYPRQVHGLFANLKFLSGFTLLGIFYAFPWLQWDGRQAVLFDLPARQFHLFGITFWPQDFFYLAMLLIIAGLSLFFFTAVAGRLWCGFACPQTVWTDVFLWMERITEGDRSKRMKLDKAPMSLRKFRIKFTKQFLWITFSLFTGFTFVGYFTPIRELGPALFAMQAGGWEVFWLLFYGFATYGNAGWMREQVCTYMCPYARFQSAMFDKDTMIIAYDEKRGEPRGSRKRKEDHKAKGLGECINCTLCVQVCPTGIDIRNGLQYQCISCSACIDVCNDVMDKMNYPRGLIRYTTENALDGKPAHILRPRIFIYGTVLLALFGSLVYAISERIIVQLDVIRDRNALYREIDNGLIENVYVLKIMNMDNVDHAYTISATGIQDLKLSSSEPVHVDAGTVYDLPIRLIANPEDLVRRSTEVVFTITALQDDALTISEKARFLGPITNP